MTIPIDPEKTSDAPRDDYSYAGVCLLSCYGKSREFETMMAAIDHLIDHAPNLAQCIVEIWCDSKACSTYSVACVTPDPLGDLSPNQMRAVAHALDLAFLHVNGGHNGIYIKSGNRRAEVGANWLE